MLDEHAGAELQVERRAPQAVECSEASCLAASILERLGAPKLDPGSARGFGGCQTTAREILGAQLHMVPELGVHVGVQGIALSDALDERAKSSEHRGSSLSYAA
jgi:hypothetical protein